jgi:hypothetical protein
MLNPQNESGLRIPIVMEASHCKKHRADKGEPCWTLRINTDKRLAPAVCGARVKRAGFTAPISEEAMSRTPSAKKPPPRFKATKQGRPHSTNSTRTKDK